MEKIKIFQGRPKPSESFVGVDMKKKITKDKFGELSKGKIRGCYIDTRWGQLYVPLSWMDKKIEIIVREQK